MEMLFEEAFVEKVGEILSDYGEIRDFELCSWKDRGYKIDAYEMDEDFENLTLIVSHCMNELGGAPAKISNSEIDKILNRVINFFTDSLSGKLKNRHRLKHKDIRRLIIDLENKFGKGIIDINSSIEIGNYNEFQLVVVNNDTDFMMIEDSIFFTLSGLNKYRPKRYFVEVDMGAVGFVTKGADIMAPGIVDADINIEKNDIVWIRDETHHKPLAIGKALVNGEDMKNSEKGKAIANLHYVGDPLWNFYKKA